MFKLPEESEFFVKKIEATVPVGEKSVTSTFKAKYRYISQERFWALNDQIDAADSYGDREERVEIQKAVLEEVLHGFSQIYRGDRELDDSSTDDVDWVLTSGPWSKWFRDKLIQEFFASYLDPTGAQSKLGNSSGRRGTGRR